MLESEPPVRKRKKLLECSSCRKESLIRSRRAAELPVEYRKRINFKCFYNLIRITDPNFDRGFKQIP
jgi:hypothetical protein